jgi:hypothetical protein
VPNASLYALWDDLFADGPATIRTTVLGEAPNRTVVVEWRELRFVGEIADRRVTFSILLGEDGTVTYQYGALADTPFAHGASATIGMEDATGATGFAYSHMEAAVAPDTAIRFRTPPPDPDPTPTPAP